MAKIEGKCREILDETEWVAIATTGIDGPHLAGTWGEYIKALDVNDTEIILVPAGGLLKTEKNLLQDNRIEILCATRQIQGTYSPGKGCRIRGTWQLQVSGEHAEAAKKKFPWAKGVLVIKAEEVIEQL